MTITTAPTARIPTTPITWLIFLSELAVPNPKLEKATQRRLGELSLVEAIAALSLLTLAERGKRTVYSKDITGVAGRSIQLKTMTRLEEKKILTSISMLGHRHQWRLRPDKIQPLREVHLALAALILKATSGPATAHLHQ